MYKVHFEELKIDTRSLNKTAAHSMGWKNITDEVLRVVSYSGVSDGFVIIQTKHTTASLVINEDEKGLIKTDLPLILQSLCPEGIYQHDRAERLLALPGEAKNAPSHLRSMIGGQCSAVIIVHDSRLQLGTWQAILFFDFDPDTHPGRMVAIQVQGLTKQEVITR